VPGLQNSKRFSVQRAAQHCTGQRHLLCLILAGVLTSDPRMVASASPIPLLTFDEATELAYFGAAVLHPLAMQPAMQNGGLAVRVKNSYNRCVLCCASARGVDASRDDDDACWEGSRATLNGADSGAQSMRAVLPAASSLMAALSCGRWLCRLMQMAARKAQSQLAQCNSMSEHNSLLPARRLAPGTLITPARDMADALVTCIVLKPQVTLMDIVSTKMLGQFGFLVRRCERKEAFVEERLCRRYGFTCPVGFTCPLLKDLENTEMRQARAHDPELPKVTPPDHAAPIIILIIGASSSALLPARRRRLSASSRSRRCRWMWWPRPRCPSP